MWDGERNLCPFNAPPCPQQSNSPPPTKQKQQEISNPNLEQNQTVLLRAL